MSIISGNNLIESGLRFEFEKILIELRNKIDELIITGDIKQE